MHSSPSSPLEIGSDALVVKMGAWGVSAVVVPVVLLVLVVSLKEKVGLLDEDPKPTNPNPVEVDPPKMED